MHKGAWVEIIAGRQRGLSGVIIDASKAGVDATDIVKVKVCQYLAVWAEVAHCTLFKLPERISIFIPGFPNLSGVYLLDGPQEVTPNTIPSASQSASQSSQCASQCASLASTCSSSSSQPCRFSRGRCNVWWRHLEAGCIAMRRSGGLYGSFDIIEGGEGGRVYFQNCRKESRLPFSPLELASLPLSPWEDQERNEQAVSITPVYDVTPLSLPDSGVVGICRMNNFLEKTVHSLTGKNKLLRKRVQHFVEREEELGRKEEEVERVLGSLGGDTESLEALSFQELSRVSSKVQALATVAEAALRKKIREEMMCSICSENSKDAVLECGHRYCTPCIEEWLKKKSQCPTCRMQVYRPPFQCY